MSDIETFGFHNSFVAINFYINNMFSYFEWSSSDVTHRKMTEMCKFSNFEYASDAKILISRASAALKRLYVQTHTENLQWTAFLTDENNHLRMYSITRNDSCLEGVHTLYERKEAKNAIKNILWDENDESLVLLSENHIQTVAYKMLCGPSFIGNCDSSYFCSKYSVYCKERRKTISNPINECKKTETGTVTSNNQHKSELFPCNTNNDGCLVSTGNAIGEGKTPDISCPSEFCMCRVSAK